jgi:hypothetical protein
MSTQPQGRVALYVDNARHYMENATALLGLGEVRKSSELLWGSMAAAVKAVAAAKGTLLWSHRDVRNYARDLARELGDENLLTTFRQAEGLHRNFYESGLEGEDVEELVSKVAPAVTLLLALIPPEQPESQIP